MKYYLGIDVGGTRVKIGVVDDQGTLLTKDYKSTPTTHQDLIETIVKIYHRYSADYDLNGLGLCMPGIIKQSKMLTSGALNFVDVDSFYDDLKEKLPVTITLINDANAVALAEKWNGNAQAYNDFACVTLGTAVGGSFFLNGKLYEGTYGLAGEFGMSLNIGVEKPTLYDTVAAHCGVVAGACRTYSSQSDHKTRDFEEIIKRSKEGDLLAEKTVEQFCINNAVMIHNLAVTVGVEAILVGGGVSQNEEIMDKINNKYKEISATLKSFPSSILPYFSTCFHHGESGIIGAVYQLRRAINEK